MLKTPTQFFTHGAAAIIAIMNGNKAGHTIIGEGLVEIGHFSSDLLLYGQNGGWDFQMIGAPTYGVCDSPEQFLKKFSAELIGDPRELCVFFTHVKKDEMNRGRGGGWRWHKWGEYVGEGKPEMEYLDDETGFEGGVYVYHIHDINWKPAAK